MYTILIEFLTSTGQQRIIGETLESVLIGWRKLYNPMNLYKSVVVYLYDKKLYSIL